MEGKGSSAEVDSLLWEKVRIKLNFGKIFKDRQFWANANFSHFRGLLSLLRALPSITEWKSLHLFQSNSEF